MVDGRARGPYLAVVREWGQSIESAEPLPFATASPWRGHCVADGPGRSRWTSALRRNRPARRLPPRVGKVRFPHEILNSPAR